MIVVNPSIRQFTIPGADMTFGVTADAGSEVKYFQCPRYVGNNLDIASSFVRINYRNANGEIDSYLVEDLAVDGDNVLFSWKLYPKVTAYKGQIKFVMCVTGPDTKVAWHTTLGTGIVLEGLEPDYTVIQAGTADVVAQLIAMVERQTGIVEDTGADQVAVVKAAAKTAQDGAVAQIEAKGASTLATIPGEYTATVNAVQSAANAIRGKVSGEVIRVDDVSPMEHYPTVKVHGKNLCPVNELFVSGEHPWANRFIEHTIVLPKGKYTASADYTQGGTETTVCLSVRDAAKTTEQIAAKALTGKTGKFTVNFEIVESSRAITMVFYSNLTETILSTNCTFTNIQLEEGTAVTAYTPYIDPTTVTVTGCGKNILPYPLLTTGGTFGGVTVTSEGNAIILNGTVTKNTAIPLFIGNIRVKGKYTISGLTGGSGATYYIQPYIGDTTVGGTTDGPRTYEWDGVLTRLNLNVVTGTIFSNLRVSAMVEHGDVMSEFEPYRAETQIPAANGTVSGLSAVSPTMTLMTDTPGVTIDCEYSRDTNKVIAEILEKITALGG